MRPLWKDIFFAVWVGMILPGITLNLFVWKEKRQETVQSSETVEQMHNGESPSIAVRYPNGTKVSLELDAYLTGVLLAEMPADFQGEALKAQAVAARTYTWKAATNGGKHGDGSICTDPACCQAYIAEEAYLSGGGSQENLNKVRKAVSSTSSAVLFYDGELIEATYFSSTYESTEAAVAVWGVDYPYLRAVSSPEEGIENMRIFTKTDLEKSLGIALMKDESQWIGPITYTDGGGIAAMEIGGQLFSGVQLRSLLGLRSTVFQIERKGEKLIITTRGYGHRVGMSQYGANIMAEQGSSWQQILQHYYPGTTVAPGY